MKNNSTYINNYSQFTNSQSGAQSSLGVTDLHMQTLLTGKI